MERTAYMNEIKAIEQALSPIEQAAKAGDLDLIKRLYVCDQYQSKDILDSVLGCACVFGHLDIVQYAHTQGCILTPKLYYFASWHGYLPIIQYIREHGVEWTESYIIYAASAQGHVQILEYALDHGCLWEKTVTRDAAKMGHLNVLKFVFERGLEFDPIILGCAAANGHLSILQYALVNKHLFVADESYAVFCSVNAGEIQCLRFCIENNFGWSIDPEENLHLIRDCIQSDQLEALMLCCDYVTPNTEHLCFAFRLQKYDFVKYLFTLLQAKNEVDVEFMINRMISTIQGRAYDEWVIFDYRCILFDEIKEDTALRTFCYFVVDAYHKLDDQVKLQMQYEKYEKYPLFTKTLLDLVFEWQEQYLHEQKVQQQIVTRVLTSIPQDVIKNCIHCYI